MVNELYDELISLRRDFHRHPEIGFEEWRTQKKVIEYLEQLDLEVEPMGGTGVVALLRGAQEGKTILLRSDLDALPVQEETGLPFSSEEEGKMHACGHDGHMAMLLVAAKILTGMQDQIKGTIKFVFQPNEEDAGAYRMIEAGVMDNPKVANAFGVHLWSQIPSGTIDIVPGPQMAASHYFYLTIKGTGGHAGFAHESIDPIYAVSGWLWGPPLIILLSFGGIFLTIRLGFFQFRYVGYILKSTFGSIGKKSEGEGTVTPFQSLTSALACTVGAGNIVGGPMYYMTKGLNMKWLGVWFSIALMLEVIPSVMIQGNAVAESAMVSFGLPPWVTGLIVMVIVALVIIGGIKRIGKFAEKVVPVMAVVYIQMKPVSAPLR